MFPQSKRYEVAEASLSAFETAMQHRSNLMSSVNTVQAVEGFQRIRGPAEGPPVLIQRRSNVFGRGLLHVTEYDIQNQNAVLISPDNPKHIEIKSSSSILSNKDSNIPLCGRAYTILKLSKDQAIHGEELVNSSYSWWNSKNKRFFYLENQCENC